jgi:hypothetical protein
MELRNASANGAQCNPFAAEICRRKIEFSGCGRDFQAADSVRTSADTIFDPRIRFSAGIH